jgi:hypothetical protein
MKYLIILLCTTLLGCVSGAPNLTAEQREKVVTVKVYKLGTTPERAFNVIAPVEAADCSGPGGSRLYGDEGKAIDTLIMKSVALGGEAVTNVTCRSMPFVNNCWAAKKCSGNAVKWQ